MTTAASAAMAVEDATTTAVNQKHGRHIGYNQDHHQKHLHQNQNQNHNASTQVQELLQGLEEATTAAVKSDLLFNKQDSSIMNSRTITTIGSGSDDGVTGNVDVDVDVGLLPIRERRLNSVGDDCDACTSRPEISQTDFKDLVRNCYNGGDTCPTEYNVPIGCWNTSAVTDMAFAFSGVYSFDDSINCWNTARVTDMIAMFQEATNFNQPLDDWDVASVTNMEFMFARAHNFNQPLDDWNVASVTYMEYMFYKATKFNQCLSTWADKTPPNVNVDNIFINSGCPNKVTVATVAPWCQGEDEQCFAPSATPSDFPSFLPTDLPSNAPTVIPTTSPTTSPTKQTDEPTATRPTTSPTKKQKKKSKKSKK